MKRPFGRGITQSLGGLTITMVINHLLVMGCITGSSTGHRLKAALGKAGDGGFGTSHLSIAGEFRASWNDMGQQRNPIPWASTITQKKWLTG